MRINTENMLPHFMPDLCLFARPCRNYGLVTKAHFQSLVYQLMPSVPPLALKLHHFAAQPGRAVCGSNRLLG